MRYYAERETEQQLNQILNQGLTFVDNISGGFVEFTTSGNREEIHHNLGRVPIGWLVIFNDGPVTFYAEDFDQWTREIMFLQSSVPNVEVRLFVM